MGTRGKTSCLDDITKWRAARRRKEEERERGTEAVSCDAGDDMRVDVSELERSEVERRMKKTI